MRRTHPARAARLWPIALAALLAVACGGDRAGRVAAFDPADPGWRFTRAADRETALEQLERLWRAMIAPPCWDASRAGDPAAADAPGGVPQFRFRDDFRYRYTGLSTFAGRIRLRDVGHHGTADAVIVETWSGGLEAFVAVDRDTLAHVMTNPAGEPFVSYYRAATRGCL